MKILIKFDAISFNGKPVSIEKEMTCPDFEIIDYENVEIKNEIEKELAKIPSVPISIDSQIMEWLDERDNIDIIQEFDLAIINNYSVIKAINNESLLVIENNEEINHEKWLKNIFKNDPDILIDYLVVYSKLKDTIINLSFNDQFKITMRSLGVATIAKTDAYKYLNDLLKTENSTEMQNKIDKHKSKNIFISEGREITNTKIVKSKRPNVMPAPQSLIKKASK